MLNHGSCSHPTTTSDELSWWRVDLSTTYTVHRVIIHNRNRERRRILNTTVYVSNDKTGHFNNSNMCNTVGQYSNDMLVINLTCTSYLAGRYVTLKHNVLGESMNFCEIEVIGEYITQSI